MKLRKIFAGMAAATIAMTMTLSASAATNLFDIVHPDESNEEINKAYYGIGAMGFFMNQTWKWNQSEWIPINDEGVIDFKYLTAFLPSVYVVTFIKTYCMMLLLCAVFILPSLPCTFPLLLC